MSEEQKTTHVPYHLSPWIQQAECVEHLWLMDSRVPQKLRSHIILLAAIMAPGPELTQMCETLILEGCGGTVDAAMFRYLGGDAEALPVILDEERQELAKQLAVALPGPYSHYVIFAAPSELMSDNYKTISTIPTQRIDYRKYPYVDGFLRAFTPDEVQELLECLEEITFPWVDYEDEITSLYCINTYNFSSEVKKLEEEDRKAFQAAARIIEMEPDDDEEEEIEIARNSKMATLHERFTLSRVLEFGRLILDYNEDWAVASFDWFSDEESVVHQAMGELLRRGGHIQ